ncbi:MAG: hypothetical protein ACD_21C00250G0042 [uncultured bacterium]|nr:MAG: hypothetical protein ACD_21C00250G0042 [uncultured bacterium]
MILNKIVNYINRTRIQLYANRNRHLLRSSPFSFNQYQNTVLNISSQKRINILRFDENVEQRSVNFIFRHDLDTQTCLENFNILADIHLETNTPLSVFIRTDNLDYPFKHSFQYIEQYLDKFQIGLHSSCYIYDNPLKKLEEEVNDFNEIYGFCPKFLTLHGLGNYKHTERMQLINDLSTQYQDFGFVFTDCVPELRTYNYVIQDCHLGSDGNRYIKKDSVILPPSINGNCYLILAHPCYWEK